MDITLIASDSGNVLMCWCNSNSNSRIFNDILRYYVNFCGAALARQGVIVIMCFYGLHIEIFDLILGIFSALLYAPAEKFETDEK